MLKSLDYFATYALILLVGSLRTIIESMIKLKRDGNNVICFLVRCFILLLYGPYRC